MQIVSLGGFSGVSGSVELPRTLKPYRLFMLACHVSCGAVFGNRYPLLTVLSGQDTILSVKAAQPFGAGEEEDFLFAAGGSSYTSDSYIQSTLPVRGIFITPDLRLRFNVVTVDDDDVTTAVFAQLEYLAGDSPSRQP